MAARAEPIANVIEIVWLTLMPISLAASLSSDTARIALPILDLLMNNVRQIMITMQESSVTIDSAVIVSCPLNSLTPGIPLTTDVNTLGALPQIRSALF